MFNFYVPFKEATSSKDYGTHLAMGSFPVSNYSTGTTPVPWERDGWKSKMSKEVTSRLHHRLRHPTHSSLLNLFRHQANDRNVDASIKKNFYGVRKNCRPCAQNADLPKISKILIPPPAVSNIAVKLHFMNLIVDGKQVNILFMLDTASI